nr:MAG TPA: chitin synthase regulator [Caudoviricetes sp.]
MKEDTLATEMLKELKAQSKRWFIIAIVELIIILFSAILFVAYLNTPTEEKEEISYSQDADTEGENSPINQQIKE